MAINFLNKVDFNQNEIDKARLVNEVNDTAAGTPVDGQLYYNTTDNVVKVGEGGAWVSISGDITALTQGTYINIDNPTGPIPTINHDLTSRTDTTSTSSPGYAGTFTTVDSVTTNTTGHITALNLKTVTMPSAEGYSWTINGDTNAGTNTVSSGDTVDIAGGKAIVTEASTRTVNIDFTPSELNTVTALSADKVVITDTSDSNNPKLALISDIINAGVTTVDTTDGTYIDLTPASATSGAVVVTADLSAVDGTSSTATRFLSKDNTWDVPSYTTNTNTTYTLPTTNGNNPDIVLTGSDSSTDIVNMEGTSTTVKVTGSGTNTLTFDLVDNVTIVGDLTVSGGDITLGSTGRIQGVDTVQDPTDAASKSYVDQSNIGQSVFQGGYNAATNTPDLDVSPAITIKKGFFWAVTDTGDFFTEEVQPGDLIYANQDNPGATFANWVVVQSGQDIATAGATDGATVKGIAGFNSAHFNVTSNGWVSSDIYSGGSNLGIVPSGGTSSKFLRGDGSFEVPAYVTYSAMNTATLGLGRLRYALGSTPAANSQSTTAGRTYGVTKNASDQLIVNVPWIDNNTQYTAGIGLTLNGTVFDANVDGTQSVAANSSSSTTGRTYKVQVDSADKMVVNVPWVNTSAVTSVSSSTDNDLLGIEVSPTTGAVKVGLDINGLTAISTLADADTLPIYDGGTNKKISILQLENHIGAAKSKKFILNTTTTDVSQQASPPGGTIGWVVDLNASLGITDALNCMVEIIETSNGRTVYAEVTRTGTGTSSKVTINFSTPVSQGAYQALITRIY